MTRGRHTLPGSGKTTAFALPLLQQLEPMPRGGMDIVVATPGCLLDLLDRNALGISHVKTLMLDEADRLLDLGFADELERILRVLPKQRQNLFFSTTFPPAVQAYTLLRDPQRVVVQTEPESAPDLDVG